MVTLAGLEPATSPSPGEQGRSIPLELQRRHDLHHRLWRRRGAGIRINPRHARATRWSNAACFVVTDGTGQKLARMSTSTIRAPRLGR
jgi:hypothetical protein